MSATKMIPAPLDTHVIRWPPDRCGGSTGIPGGGRCRAALCGVLFTAAVMAWVPSGAGCNSIPFTASTLAAWSVGVHLNESAARPFSGAETRLKKVRGQLSASGRWLVYPDGSRFRWRGATGFALNEQVSSGRQTEAVAFFAWASRTGFNVVRVLVMLPKGWFADRDFTPEEGLAALPRTLALAREADLYVQVTVLANTSSLSQKADLASYVERAGRICATAGNCALVEIANEMFHETQRADVHDPAVLARWAARVPSGIPVSLGASATGSATLVSAAPVVTVKLDRTGDRWRRVARARDLAVISSETGRFVIDNEPTGASEAAEPESWDDLPDVFFAQGALSRVFEVGSNFHFQDGLRTNVPGPVQQKCAEAFIAGARIVNDSYMLTFQDAGWPYSPVRAVRPTEGAAQRRPGEPPARQRPVPDAVGAYAGLTQVFPESAEPSSVLVLIGGERDPEVEWRQPWGQVGVIADLPHVKVWSIARAR